MKVYHEHTTGAQVHFRYYDFDKWIDKEDDFVFIDAPQVFTDIPDDFWKQKIVYLEQEEPNRFFSNVGWFNHYEFDDKFSEVFSICPYTTDWYNSMGKNHTNVFMPITYQPQQEDKLYDICFAGHIYAGQIEEDVSVLKNFNYRVISNSEHKITTDKSVSQEEKLQIISQSKISLVHNLLYPTEEHIANVKKISGWEKNAAFSRLDEGIVPQIKGRVFEAAMCKSLILCQRDPWNVIERFFEPEKEFVYYDKGCGKEKIEEILANYENYLPVIEAAYEKSLNYTTKSFATKYLKAKETI